MTVTEHAILTETLEEMQQFLSLLATLGLLDLRTRAGHALTAGADRIHLGIAQSQAILRQPHLLAALTPEQLEREQLGQH
jgi:hypothetical protein